MPSGIGRDAGAESTASEGSCPADLVELLTGKGQSGWVVRDTWNPGDFCMGFKTGAEALAEPCPGVDATARERF